MFDDQDMLELEIEFAIADFRGGSIGEITLIDILRYLGLTWAEVIDRVQFAKSNVPARRAELVPPTARGGPDGGIARFAAERTLGDPSVTSFDFRWLRSRGWLFRAEH
jgi:hypothetical protein